MTALKHVQSGAILVDLSHYGLLRFSGEDALTFLQSQVSCDVREVTASKAQYGSYCTPKGRVLANFTFWQNDDEWLMQLPASLCPAIRQRLTMFVLRAKLKIDDCSNQWIKFGVAGSKACGQVEDAVEIALGECVPLDVKHTAQASIICHATDRFEIVAAPDMAQRLWKKLSINAQPVDAACWSWLEIQSGIPVITAATQEQFLPQMINLDLIGAVSFNKGCYPGQEVVARTQYLGRLKRRMYLAKIDTSEPVSIGDDLYSAATQDQSCGKIVNAAPSPESGYDVLAVIQKNCVETGDIKWKNPHGLTVQIGTLPYVLEKPLEI